MNNKEITSMDTLKNNEIKMNKNDENDVNNK